MIKLGFFHGNETRGIFIMKQNIRLWSTTYLETLNLRFGLGNRDILNLFSQPVKKGQTILTSFEQD